MVVTLLRMEPDPGAVVRFWILSADGACLNVCGALGDALTEILQESPLHYLAPRQVRRRGENLDLLPECLCHPAVDFMAFLLFRRAH